MRKVDILHFFLNVWLNKKELHICFCMQSVTMCCFDWSIWRKSSFIQILAGERNLLIAFADNCEYSLVLHRKSVSSNFLKVNCNIEFITISVSFFILYYIKSTDLSFHFEWTLLLMHDFIILCIGSFEKHELSWSSIKCRHISLNN